METLSSFAIIAVAGLIHASFQLSVSMLTLLSSHTIGHKRSHRRVLLLTNAFTFGAFVMTLLLLSFSSLILTALVQSGSSTELAWVICCGLLFGLGFAVWLFYYRREAGTSLWIPREFARFLTSRTKATRQSSEAFSLGLSSVLAEILFIFVPVLTTALVLITLNPMEQLLGIGLYALVASCSLLGVNMLIGSGHSISRIQKWRETNKGFLQFAAGSALVGLGFYLYVDQVLTTSVLAAAQGL